MYTIRKISVSMLMTFVSLAAVAQSGTNSPYSQYGFGELTEQSTSFNRGMNGLGIGFREHNQVNYMNPASYSAIDSLSFIFDAGIAGQITNFEENGKRLNANNANLEYIVAAFRLAKHLGMSFGIVPFTTVGYSYSSTSQIGGDAQDKNTFTNTYSGSGGLHQVYLGLGYQLFKGFSLGVNGSYLWGSIDKTVTNSYSDAYINTLSKIYSAEVRNYRLDFGLQYQARLSKNDAVSLGATYTLGHKLNSDPECKVISRNAQTSVSDTAIYIANNALEMPSMYGAGIMWNHKNKLRLGVDYSLQQWSKVSFPVYDVTNNQPQYTAKEGMFKDRHKFTVGGEYVAKEDGRKFLGRLRYRFGVSYATPYQVINGIDGPKEISVSAGVGIPLVNAYNNRSVLSISAQWMRRDAKNLITENAFRINIGFTFNEKWFEKWKMQ